ncbi:hypothetical protein BU24DRAFT_452474 [Aaosphaeria arxii CBS 175.79]|uniref:Uncharacterized protein n=1 Tax=Aaosphaeria arxii CBS 175.79 TaxID=1450172 RepID=A0A6A5XL01_9PLEO|nr:uncharacterized protein BU24DRAFT_452474 [Aaosphaeria arxii CBS 175.79]KAF2013623.1 hypothetical protein BU24DRAFT_452474 [Aaosphaeria arxii CBS 175.79]
MSGRPNPPYISPYANNREAHHSQPMPEHGENSGNAGSSSSMSAQPSHGNNSPANNAPGSHLYHPHGAPNLDQTRNPRPRTVQSLLTEIRRRAYAEMRERQRVATINRNNNAQQPPAGPPPTLRAAPALLNAPAAFPSTEARIPEKYDLNFTLAPYNPPATTSPYQLPPIQPVGPLHVMEPPFVAKEDSYMTGPTRGLILKAPRIAKGARGAVSISMWECISKLMNPPANPDDLPGLVTVTVFWAAGIIGWGSMDWPRGDRRPVLAKTSEIRRVGLELGVPQRLFYWLTGHEHFERRELVISRAELDLGYQRYQEELHMLHTINHTYTPITSASNGN